MKHAIPDDWDGTFCRLTVCWPDSTLWRALLRGLLTEPARGYFWDEKTGSIRGVLGQFRQSVDQNLLLECVIMSCGDASALITALNTNFAALTEAIQALNLAVTVEPASPTITVEPASPDINVTCSPDVNLSCGGGGYGPGGPTSPGYGPYGQGPIIQPPANPGQTTPGSGPGGYDPPASWPGTPTEYDEYKCKAATFLVDAYISYVDGWARNWENLSSINAYTDYLWAIFRSTPWVALLAPELIPLIGSYLTTLAVGFELTEPLIDEYLDYLRSIEQDWICDFYNAVSVEDARDVALNYVGGGGLIVWPTAVTEFHVDVFFKNYVLNVLFEEHELVTAYDGTVDCSECGCSSIRVYAGGGYNSWGILTEVGDGYAEFEGELIEGQYYWCQLLFNVDSEQVPCGPTVNLLSMTDTGIGWVNPASLRIQSDQSASGSANRFYGTQSSEITFPLNDVGSIVFKSSIPFTGTVTWENAG